MKFLFSTLIILFISSCKKDDSKNIEKRDFIVSKFNDDIEKHFQEAKLKNPDLAIIKEIKFYDYPKGAVNFIFLKDNSVYYYNEQLFSLICGTGLENLKPAKRVLSSDSLKIIKYSEIYNHLKAKASEEKMKDGRQNLRHLSFAFENDTIKNYNISKLLQDIDSLGYHSYTIRRIAPFEINALSKTK
ncbi:hypothetical protein [Chryseobacterium sp. YIM B08800]|uniref:hypothetical protein n=1 Tax=Chryseobacterium sp. YIM B08800 TaxID=2984136 RepID=UPI00223F9586|nr:hypothetical protein [Chryseobacterium sp. YIM B08800]